MARLSRKEIKRDEVQEALGRGVGLVQTHARTILTVAAGLVVLVLVVLGVVFYLEIRAARALEELEQALKVYRAPIEATAAEPDNVQDPSFPDEESRQARAAELLAAVHEKYGSTLAGGVAGVYLAEFASEEGDWERARQLWTEFIERHDDHVMVASVKLNLISLDRQEGKIEELAQELRDSLEQEDRILPEDAILYHLGLILDEMGNEEEAQEIFQQLIDDYPRSLYSVQARQFVDQTPGALGQLPFGT